MIRNLALEMLNKEALEQESPVYKKRYRFWRIFWIVLALHLFLTLIGVLFFFLARELQSGSRWLMEPLAYLGRLSYCIYLLHFLVLIWLAPGVLPQLSGAIPAWFRLIALYAGTF